MELKKRLADVPDELEIYFCSYTGGHMFEVYDTYQESVDGGEEPDVFVLYTRRDEEAVLLTKGGRGTSTRWKGGAVIDMDNVVNPAGGG